MLKDAIYQLPTQTYHDDNGDINRVPYISPVEGGYEVILESLHKNPAAQSSLVLGYGGLLNLDLMASGHYKGAILADINEGQITFWNDVLDRLRTHDKLDTFLDSYRDSHLSDVVDYAHKAESRSFLRDQGQYDFVRNAVLDGNVVPLRLSVFDTQRHQQLQQALKQQGMELGLINITNILGGIGETTRRGFWSEQIPSNAKRTALRNVDAIASNRTYIMDSSELMPISSLPHNITSVTDLCSVFMPRSNYMAQYAPPPLPDY